jgi:hypothetical protein
MQLVLLLKPVSFRGTVLVEHLKVDLFVFYGVLQMLRSLRARSSWSVEREVGIAECQCRLRPHRFMERVRSQFNLIVD